MKFGSFTDVNQLGRTKRPNLDTPDTHFCGLMWVVFVDRWIVFSRVNVSVNTINRMIFVSV